MTARSPASGGLPDRPPYREASAVVLRLQWQDLIGGEDDRVAGLPGRWGTVIQVCHDRHSCLACPSDAIQFYVERAHPDQAHAAGEIPLEQLHRWSCLVDPMVTVLSNLLISHGPAERPEAAPLFGQIAMALRLHVVGHYGKAVTPSRQARGGLAPWQLRRATEMMEARLMEDLCLADIARACRLSASHFGRAFRQTTGLPPHRWLLERRIDKARQMLQTSDEPLSGVALQCGFTDQSHFTRAFTASVGISPGRWRRRQGDG